MSKFKIPILANCGHCETKIRNVELRKQNDGCYLCKECNQEDALRKFHTVSQNYNTICIKLSEDLFKYVVYYFSISIGHCIS